MTLTELEKLEALHAAGMTWSWKASANEYHADSGAHEVTIDPLASEEECANVAAFINALHNAFPAMAKALREAWKKLEESDAAMQLIGDSFKRVVGEREEARAEMFKQADARKVAEKERDAALAALAASQKRE